MTGAPAEGRARTSQGKRPIWRLKVATCSLWSSILINGERLGNAAFFNPFYVLFYGSQGPIAFVSVIRRYRELGNQAFVKGMDWKALELYNESVSQAPQGCDDKEKVRGKIK